MSDLNLTFDTGSKSISLGNTSGSGNLGFVPDMGATSPIKTIDLGPSLEPPNLTVTDPAGFGMLTQGKNPDIIPPQEKSAPKEEFSFFKPSEPEPSTDPLGMGGIVDGGLPSNSVNPDEAIFMNKEQSEEAYGFKPIHRLTPQDIKNEKIDLLYKFKKLEGQGIRTTMNYNMNSHLDEMRNEYIKLKKQREIDNSIKFQRKMMMAFVTGVEFMNNKFDPFSIKLDGWSESVNEEVVDYDEIFEELYEKYGGGDSEVAPELRLLFALGGSAFMFHLQNTMFKSSLPGMDDILKQNPELMKQFASAAVGSMNAPGGGGAPPGMAGMMRGMGFPGMGGQGMGGMGGGQNQGPPRQAPRRPPSPQRPDMDGPDGLDDIIKTMNLEPDKLPDLDNISLISGDTDRKSGITLNL